MFKVHDTHNFAKSTKLKEKKLAQEEEEKRQAVEDWKMQNGNNDIEVCQNCQNPSVWIFVIKP